MAYVLAEPGMPDILRVVGEPAPQRTADWMRCLVAAVSYVATSHALPTSTLYAADAPPSDLMLDTMAMLHPLAPIHGLETLLVGDTWYAEPPNAWMVLHPVGAVKDPDLDEPDSGLIATGALLLPGIPEIGLDHRAAWAAVDEDGNIARMQYTTHADVAGTVDLSVMAALLPGTAGLVIDLNPVSCPPAQNL